jgi:hypothetical protein
MNLKKILLVFVLGFTFHICSYGQRIYYTKEFIDPICVYDKALKEAIENGSKELASASYDSLEAYANRNHRVALTPVAEFAILAYLGRWKAISDYLKDNDPFLDKTQIGYTEVFYKGRKKKYKFNDVFFEERPTVLYVAYFWANQHVADLRKALQSEKPDNWQEIDRLLYEFFTPAVIKPNSFTILPKCPYTSDLNCIGTFSPQAKELFKRNKASYIPKQTSFPSLMRLYGYSIPCLERGLSVSVGYSISKFFGSEITKPIGTLNGFNIQTEFFRKGGIFGLELSVLFSQNKIPLNKDGLIIDNKNATWGGGHWGFYYGRVIYRKGLDKFGATLGYAGTSYSLGRDYISDSNPLHVVAKNYELKGWQLSLTGFYDYRFNRNLGQKYFYESQTYNVFALRLAPYVGFADFKRGDGVEEIVPFGGLNLSLNMGERSITGPAKKLK